MKNLKQVITVVAMALFMLGSFNINAQKSKLEPEQYDQIKNKYPNLNPFEKELIERFNSVLNYSKSYWSNKYQVKEVDNSEAFADAIGGLCFWETGPGSLIAGAVYSMLVNTYE